MGLCVIIPTACACNSVLSLKGFYKIFCFNKDSSSMARNVEKIDKWHKSHT